MTRSWMESEIRSQPALLARLAEGAAPLARELARAISRRHPRFVVLTARGSSDHAAIYGKYLLETDAGLVASLAAPSVYSIYGGRPDVRDALVIGISQSGQSPDIVTTVAGARAGGALTLAITNDESSPLAQASDLRLPLQVGPERSVAATKTFTAELLAVWLLVQAMARSPRSRLAPRPSSSARPVPPARASATAWRRFTPTAPGHW